MNRASDLLRELAQSGKALLERGMRAEDALRVEPRSDPLGLDGDDEECVCTRDPA